MLVRVGQEVQALPRRVERGRLVVEAALAAASLLVFVLLARAFVRAGHVVALDDGVARRAAEGFPAALEWASRLFTYAGGMAGSAVVTAATCLVLVRARRLLDAALVAGAVVGITVIVALLKAHYERPRPELGSSIQLPSSFSFPSGHAATAVVLYGAIGLLLAGRSRSRLRAAGWLVAAAALALAIGSSRVVLNVHYVSDVVAGFAVGLAWLCGCLIVRDVAAARAGARRPPG